MDYKAIYDRFISDRFGRPPNYGEYFEIHHIVPRSFGGGDEAENLILLSPEDHFFAHLLLARIYGGSMWAALFLMSGDRWGRKGLGLRSAYGLARREWSKFAKTQEGLKGDENGNYDHEVFSWVNLDTGEKVWATKHQMWSVYGSVRAGWTSVVSGQKNSFLGWCIATREPRIRGNKGKVFHFVSRGGETFSGTQQDFCAFSGCSIATASRVVRNESVTKSGWRLAGNKDRLHCESKSTGRPSAEGRGVTWIVCKGGVVFEGKRKEVAAFIGAKNVASFLLALDFGKMYGWTIEKKQN